MSRKYIIITYQQTNEAELTLNPSYEIFTCSKFTPWCQNGISLVQLRERKKTESTTTYLFRPLFWILGIPTGSNPNVDKATIQGQIEIYNISKNQPSRHYDVHGRPQKPIFRPLFRVPWGPIWTYPKFDLTRFFPRFCLCHMQKSFFLAFQFLSYKVTSDFLYCVLFIICMI